MNNIRKRIVAVICVIAMTVACFCGFIPNTEIEAATLQAEPMYFDDFTNMTLKDFGNGTIAALPDGVYNHSNAPSRCWNTMGVSSFDKHVFSVKVKFLKGSESTNFKVAGNGNQSDGFAIYVSSDGTELYLKDQVQGASNRMVQAANYKATYTAQDAGVTSFLDTEFYLQITFQYGDFDGDSEANDVKIGMYFNGQLYKSGVTQINDCNMGNFKQALKFQLDAADSAIDLYSVIPDPVAAEPISLVGFGNITLKDFGNGSVPVLPDGLYNNSNVPTRCWNTTGIANYDKQLFSVRVKYLKGGESTSFKVAGNGNQSDGFAVYVSTDGKELYLADLVQGINNRMVQTPNFKAIYKASETEIDTFLNRKFLLQISFEYGDFDNDGESNDVKVGMYFDGKLYKNAETIINDCNMDNFRQALKFQLSSSDSAMELYSVEPKVISTPVSVDGFTNVTISDFVKEADRTTVLEDKTYNASETPGAYVIVDSETLNQKLVSMKMKFLTGGVGTGIQIGEKKDLSSGFAVYTNATGSELYLRDINRNENNRIIAGNTDRFTYSAQTAGVSSFLNNEFYLQMSFEHGDFDADGLENDLKVGMYINGKLYGNAETVINDCNLSRLGSRLTFRLYDADSSLSLASVKGLEDSTVITETLDSGLMQLTFGDFGVRDGKYTINLNGTPYTLSADGLYHGTTMENVVFSGDMTYSKETVATWAFAGKDTGWRGLLLSNDEDGNLVLKNMTGYKSEGFSQYTFTSDKAGVKLVDNSINVKYSIEFVALDQDGLKNDVKFGVWFNDVLYNNEYYYLGGLAPYIGQHMSIYCETKDASLKVKSVNKTSQGPQPEAGLKKISFADFGIDDGTYRINQDGVPYSLSTQGTYAGKSLDGVLFDGSILYSKHLSSSICIGGKDNPWRGLRFYNDEDGNLIMQNLTGNTSTSSFRKQAFTSQAAGTQLIGRKVSLKMSIQYVDNDGDGKKNDVKLGVWFNGYLYGNQYLYLDNLADSLGTDMGIYCETKDTSVTVNSYDGAVVVREMPNAAFKKITFSHFGIPERTFSYDGTDDFNAVGKLDGISSLNRTVLCGDLLLKKDKNAVICIGGADNIWYGIRITIRPNGKIGVSWIGDNFNVRYKEFGETTAQTALYDHWVNMMMSTEIVDGDGDGQKDDIKLGFWFNGRLYEGEYIIIPDKAAELGTYLGIYCGEKGAKVSIRSVEDLVEPYNLARYGLDSNWQETLLNTGMKGRVIVGGSKDVSPFTGDRMKIPTGVVIAVAFSAVLLGAWLVLKRRRDVELYSGE